MVPPCLTIRSRQAALLASLCALFVGSPAFAGEPLARLLPPPDGVTPASSVQAPEPIPQSPTPVPQAGPAPVADSGLTLGAAITWALQNNPELRVFRQERGVAEAAVVIAQTYPFNPIWEGRVQQNSGPASAGITNQVLNEHLFVLEVELHGQRRYRRQEASALLTKTEWDIATQELTLALKVLRAFQNVIYQRERLRLLEETIRLNEQLVNDTKGLFNAGMVGGADKVLAQTELEATRGLLGPARTTLVTAIYELRRALGMVDGPLLVLDGRLDGIPTIPEGTAGTLQALERRPELYAQRAAVAQAEAALRLELANRYGNPVIGPAYTYDPTRVSSVGAQLNVPLPVLNTHRGQIQQRQAEEAKAVLVLRQTEIQVRQDVEAALQRLATARAGAEVYRDRILPALQTGLTDLEQLFHAGKVDVLRILDLRRKWISARDSYLTALWEVSQAQADLIAAVGDLTLAGLPAPPFTAGLCRP
jgi:outer membrane protein TolC